MNARHKFAIAAVLLSLLITLAWKQEQKPLPTYTITLIQGNRAKESWVTTQPPFPQGELLVIVYEDGKSCDMLMMTPGMRLHSVKNP